MSSIVLTGDTSGQVTIAAPAVAGTNTLTLQAATATSAVNTLATAVASTSGTSIDFTGLPAWVKRITVMLNSVSLNGTAHILVQIGSGSITSSGYLASSGYCQGPNVASNITSTAGFVIIDGSASQIISGLLSICLISGTTWVSGHSAIIASAGGITGGGNSPSLASTLDRVRITTTNGTDTFDAGSVNILYEG